MCFLKLYFINEKLDKNGKSMIQGLWRNIFFRERAFSNLNRTPDWILIISSLSKSTLLEIPYKFLSDTEQFIVVKSLNFFVPNPILFLQLSTPVTMSILCLHCPIGRQMLVNIPTTVLNLLEFNDSSDVIFKKIENVWIQTQKDFKRHIMVRKGDDELYRLPPLPKSHCNLNNLINRVVASNCATLLMSSRLNYTYKYGAPRRIVLGFTGEYFYTQFDRLSFKKMKTKIERYDTIHVYGRIEYFSYAIVEDGQRSGLNLTGRLVRCFHWNVWVVLVLSGISVIIGISLFYRNYSTDNFPLLVGTVFISVFSSVLDQYQANCTKVNYRKSTHCGVSSSRILFGIWILLAFGFSCSYKSVLLSVLVSPSVITPPPDISSLIASKLPLITSNYKLLKELIDHINRTSVLAEINLPQYMEDLIDKFDTSLYRPTETLHLSHIFGALSIQRMHTNQTAGYQKFAIFDFKHSLTKFKNFISKNFPQIQIAPASSASDSNARTDLAMLYRWSCSRQFVINVIQRYAMSLYETGFYNKWEEYFFLGQELRERSSFVETFNCSKTLKGKYSAKSNFLCVKKSHEIVHLKMEALNGFFLMSMTLLGSCWLAFIVEHYLSRFGFPKISYLCRL